jgi:hypothetical protein
MVNQACKDVDTWINEVVEIITDVAMATCKPVLESKERLDISTGEKDEVKQTISIEVRQKNSEV